MTRCKALLVISLLDEQIVYRERLIVDPVHEEMILIKNTKAKMQAPTAPRLDLAI